MLMVRHGAHRGAGGRGAAPVAGAVRRLRDHDHPQDAARPARRPDPLPGRARARTIDQKRLPGHAGRTARCTSSPPRPWPSARRRTPEFRRLPEAGASRTRRRSPRRLTARGFRARVGRHRQPPHAGRRGAQGHLPARTRRSALGSVGHHGQQEHDSLRHPAADGRLRHPPRHARGDDARHGAGGDGGHRRARSRARSSPETTPRSERSPAHGLRALRRVPARLTTAAPAAARRPPVAGVLLLLLVLWAQPLGGAVAPAPVSRRLRAQGARRAAAGRLRRRLRPALLLLSRERAAPPAAAPTAVAILGGDAARRGVPVPRDLPRSAPLPVAGMRTSSAAALGRGRLRAGSPVPAARVLADLPEGVPRSGARPVTAFLVSLLRVGAVVRRLWPRDGSPPARSSRPAGSSARERLGWSFGDGRRIARGRCRCRFSPGCGPAGSVSRFVAAVCVAVSCSSSPG